MQVDKVDIVLKFSPSQKTGDFSTHKDGYYFFYSYTDRTIKVNKTVLKFENRPGANIPPMP